MADTRIIPTGGSPGVLHRDNCDCAPGCEATGVYAGHPAAPCMFESVWQQRALAAERERDELRAELALAHGTIAALTQANADSVAAVQRVREELAKWQATAPGDLTVHELAMYYRLADRMQAVLDGDGGSK